MNTYTHICTNTYTHTHAHIHTHTRTHTHTCTRHRHSHTDRQTATESETEIIGTYSQAQTDADTQEHAHAHAQIKCHTTTYMHILACKWTLSQQIPTVTWTQNHSNIWADKCGDQNRKKVLFLEPDMNPFLQWFWVQVWNGQKLMWGQTQKKRTIDEERAVMRMRRDLSFLKRRTILITRTSLMYIFVCGDASARAHV